jgi:hypothetical protein
LHDVFAEVEIQEGEESGPFISNEKARFPQKIEKLDG